MLWEGGKSTFYFKNLSWTSFKGKIFIYHCVTSNNISNCKMKTIAIMESQISLHITEVLFPMNLCVNSFQSEKLPGNLKMLMTVEFHDPFIAEGLEQMSVCAMLCPCPALSIPLPAYSSTELSNWDRIPKIWIPQLVSDF